MKNFHHIYKDAKEKTIIDFNTERYE